MAVNRMEEWIYTLYRRHKLYYCIECGKCVAVCPMQDIFESYGYAVAPRGMIKKVALLLDVLKDEAIWLCLQCYACSEACPAGVKYRDFMVDVRKHLIDHGNIANVDACGSCGKYYTTRYILDHVKKKSKHSDSDYLEICPECRDKLLIAKIRTMFHILSLHGS